jgi:hypothetical protein
MKQPVAGVAPAPKSEVTVMIVWPSIAATAWGRFWGRRCLNSFGFNLLGVPITVGRLMALVSIPFVLPVFFHMLVPRLPFVVAGWVNASCRRYRVTNLRVVVEHGLGLGEQSSVALDRYDEIDVEVLPGQAWFPAGDLVFRLGAVETFRLPGVPRPEQIRQVCLKSQRSFVGVQKAREAGVAAG